MHHSGIGELARPTLDRLLVDVRPQRFGTGKCYQDHPKPKFHARGGANPPKIAEARLTVVSRAAQWRWN